jgi:hypothetical protein
MVCSRARQIGLDLNLSKCVLWGPEVTDNNTQASIPDSVPLRSPLRRTKVTPIGVHSGIKVLGIPVCHPGQLSDNDFAAHVWEARVNELQSLCDALVRLPQAHVQYTLLRCCLTAAIVTDHLRACPLAPAAGQCHKFSAILHDTLGAIAGVPLSDARWTQ